MRTIIPVPLRHWMAVFLGAFAVMALPWPGLVARAATTDYATAFSGTIAPGDVANLIGPGGTVDGAVVNDGELWFNNPDLPSSTISAPISGTGALLFFAPVIVDLAGSNSYSGGTYIYSGTVTMSGTLSGGSGEMFMGGGPGTLLSVAGTVTSGVATLGDGSGEAGDATVTSGGSWTAGEFTAGNVGTSIVTLSGGSLSAGTTYFGRQAGGVGTLLLSSGTFSASDDIFFGNLGTATLSITGGRLSSASDIFVGYLNTASGTISGGTISAGAGITAGFNAAGSLTVNGGLLSSTSGVIGQATGGNGSVTMNTGLWQVTSDLQVGASAGGVGNLVVAGGGVTSGRGLVGNLAGSTGNVSVTSGSWALTGGDPDGNLQVGVFGTGTMTVSGGIVSAAGANIGFNTTGTGAVVVNGGSLAISGLTNIGNFARGSLQLSSGSISTGQVIVGAGNFGGNLGRGTVTVTGGTWNSSLSLTVGQGGNGTYAQSGGYVSAAAGFIGSANALATAGTGSVVVTGGTLAYGGNLAIGNAQVGSTGSGTMTVSGGGFVSVADTLTRAANGTLNLDGGGTLSIGVGGTTGSLPIDVLDNGLLIFNRISNYTYVNSISGTGAVAKYGASVLTMTGTNSYSGPTNVYSGTLNLLGQLGQTDVTVHSGATLSGTGVVLGSVTIGANGTISPGAAGGGVGMLTTSDFFMAGSSSLAILEITGSNPVQYDKVMAQTLADTLAWGGGSLAISMSTSSSYVDGTQFMLFDGFVSYSGPISGISLNAAGTDFAGLAFSDSGGGLWRTGRNGMNQYLEFDTSNGVLAVVPEPPTILLFAAGAGAWAAIGGWRRRTRKPPWPGDPPPG